MTEDSGGPAIADDYRPMPDSFQPSFDDDGERTIWAAMVNIPGRPGLTKIGLEFRRTSDTEVNRKLLEALRQAAWQSMESVRLGQFEHLTRFEVIPLDPGTGDEC